MALSNRTVTRFINHATGGGISGTHTPTGTPDFVVLLVGGSLSNPTTITYGGVSLGSPVADFSDFGRKSLAYVLASPSSGAQAVVVSGLGGGNVTVWCITYTGVDVGGTPYNVRVGRNFGGAIPSSYSEAVTSAADSELLGLVAATVTSAYTRGASQTALTGSPVLNDNNGWSGDAWYAPGNTSPVTGTTAGPELCAISVLEVLPGAVGPTIDTQPVADTGLINGDPARRSTVYTVAATGDTISEIEWTVDGSPVSDGGIYDIVEAGIGTNTATSTITVTRTVKTGTPFDIQVNVADANGTTASDIVADTWYTGPVLSKSFGTTNGSGVDTLTITSDYPNADGEFTVVTATSGPLTKQVARHYEP